jgi:hypothetical protein
MEGAGVFFKLGMVLGAFVMMVLMIMIFGILETNREFKDGE